MAYQNRQAPEGINNVETGWQRDFILLVVGFFVGLALLLWLTITLLGWSARYVPFSWEQSLSSSLHDERELNPRTRYLQTLANDLARAGGLGEGLSVTVHYQPDSTVNAFATLGGHVFILEGLLDNVDSEQGLAFVLAHEIAHVHYRHPLQSAARQAGLSLIGALVFGNSDLSWLAGSGGQLALLDYSRKMELEADTWALSALHAHYGHVAGADSLFQWLQEEQAGSVPPKWLATHPDSQERIERLHRLAEKQHYQTQGSLSPLPDHEGETKVRQ